MKNLKNNFRRLSLSLPLILMLFVVGCSKSEDNPAVVKDGSLVNISIDGISYEEDQIDFEKKSSSRAGSSPSGVVQDTTLVFDDYSVDVVMEKDNGPIQKSIGGGTVQSSNNGLRAATVVRNKLTPGVYYRVVVYNSNGTFKATKDYVYGTNPANNFIALDSKVPYTFVIYSINSKTNNLPNVTYKNGVQTFANAQLLDVSQDLMVQVIKDRTLNVGDNYLGVIMKHRYSMITTKLTMDPKMTGTIKDLKNTTIGKVDASATFNFVDGTLTYKNNQSTDAIVVFPDLSVGIREIISYPTLLINPQNSAKTLTFGLITINDETKTGFKIENIKITPGCKYNLNLNFRTCTQEVKMADDALNWRYEVNSTYTGCIDPVTGKEYKNGELLTRSFSAPASDYGFTFDIKLLDNAINMRVNNTRIFGTSALDTAQIQFQTYDNTANGEGIISQNIRFLDGSEYGKTVNGVAVPDIWKLTGTDTAPIIRIMISKTGEVTMLGSKTDGGPLFPLILKAGLQFNKVPWNTTSSNTVVVTQRVSNTTFVVGRGYGQKKIACP
ncbi:MULTISPECIES: fimbrillin family protein [Sphingobacterium]|uniref:Fimbrillin family protein n=1 Tax=Sphingobacterium tenebrionis TaxID=3111775 RepID=A0ABU8I6S6_9SPHI|nr:fimbrillin family protein [Sphingobacterium sp. CZ-2]QBR11384.1 hypothetical protein E3D81_04010 [Sphingobacterium sp. CZ-2]